MRAAVHGMKSSCFCEKFLNFDEICGIMSYCKRHTIFITKMEVPKWQYRMTDYGKPSLIKKMNRTDLKNAAGISFNILAKLGRNEFVSMESIYKICVTLNCRIEDVMEFDGKAAK